jgi:hypothetical protein
VVGYSAWADVIHEALQAGPAADRNATAFIAG